MPCPGHARILLGALVSQSLELLRARAAWLEQHVEAPARAAAREVARVLTSNEQALLRSERLVDQEFHRAYQALLKGHRRAAAPVSPRTPALALAGALTLTPAPAPQCSLPAIGPVPPTPSAAGTVFLDFHSARRAVRAEEEEIRAAAAELQPDYCI
jgi:hypothetical protein